MIAEKHVPQRELGVGVGRRRCSSRSDRILQAPEKHTFSHGKTYDKDVSVRVNNRALSKIEN